MITQFIKRFIQNKKQMAIVLAVLGALIVPSVAMAVAYYSQPNIKLRTFLNDGSIVQPTAFAFAPDGRMFVAQRNGDIKVVWNGFNTAAGIKHVEVDDSQEHGLLNLVLDPHFATNPYMYIYYTGPDSVVRVAKARVGLDYIEPFQVLWTARGPSTSINHQGGGMEIDNYDQIIFSTGDNYISSNAQDVTNDYGKAFRIKTDGSIPADNPYVATPGAAPALFAVGLRNPFSLIVDRQSNSVYVGDVGQSAYEEINAIGKGKNYGWPNQEGHNCSGQCAGYEQPLFTYAHPTGGYTPGAAVVAGLAYHGDYYGGLFDNLILYTDGMQGRLNTITKQGMDAPVLTGVGFIVDMATDAQGQIYLLDYYAGKIQRIAYGTGPMNDEPYAEPTCTPVNVTVGATVSCQANAGDQNNDQLAYEWDLGDGRVVTDANPSFSYASAGQYKVRLRLSDDTTSLPFPPIDVNVGERPAVTLLSPDVSAPVSAGSAINYQIAATEADGTPINDENVKVDVNFHHNTHSHEFVRDRLGKSGSFTIPTNIETDLDIWLRLTVTVTDHNGATTAANYDLFYKEAALKLTSAPAGAAITIDGSPATNGDGYVGVSGIVRQLEAPATHAIDGLTYRFVDWSDGNTERVRSLAFPDATAELTARYAYDPALNSPNNSLLPNGLFEELQNGVPVGWSILSTAGTVGTERFDVAHTGAYGCQVAIAVKTAGALRGCQVGTDVLPGQSYLLKSWYRANRPTRLIVDYYYDQTSLGQVVLARPGASDNWAELTNVLQVPANANKLRVQHVIDGVGTLAVDDYSLVQNP